ncbi:MAG: PEP-CTERM sorting domain-containing protein [Myxococcales bacterium]|nr:PEP-CTERM sorting domain-containing protein [Myxococcales bacterium]
MKFSAMDRLYLLLPLVALALAIAGSEGARADFLPPSGGGCPNGGDLSLDGLAHGQVVNVNSGVQAFVNPFAGCAEIHAKNRVNAPGDDYAVVFDTNTNPTTTPDPDLTGPPWSGGNVSPNTQMGNILTVQGQDYTGCANGICTTPQDEDMQTTFVATWIELRFDTPALLFGFDLIDVELFEMGSVAFCESSVACTGSAVGSEIAFFDPSGATFDLIDRDGAIFGNNTVNRIAGFTAEELGMVGIGSVRLNFGGSAGVGNFVINPEPGTAILFGTGLVALAMRRRRI